MNHWTAEKTNIPAAVHARLLQIAKAEGVAF
jgi:poly(3-hydroxyalkanoate) synthetase